MAIRREVLKHFLIFYLKYSSIWYFCSQLSVLKQSLNSCCQNRLIVGVKHPKFYSSTVSLLLLLSTNVHSMVLKDEVESSKLVIL